MSFEGLSLEFDDEYDGTAMLTATVAAGGFSGRGRACFNVAEIREFATALAAFSHGAGDAPGIWGGYRNPDSFVPPQLSWTVLLSLKAIALDTLGHFALRVEAAEEPSSNELLKEESRVVALVRADSQALKTFADDLLSMTRGTRHTATLDSCK